MTKCLIIKIANDAQISPSTTCEHFQILYDTLIAIEVPAFIKSVKRKAIQTSKFYFFDLGVVRCLLKRKEMKEYDADFEVDFILDEQIAIEVKATQKVSSNDFKNILALKEENICSDYYLVSRDPHEQVFKGIKCLPYNKFLEKLWDKVIC